MLEAEPGSRRSVSLSLRSWSDDLGADRLLGERVAAAALDPEGACPGEGGDHLAQIAALEQEPDAIVGGVAVRELARGHELRVARPAERLAVVVRAEAALEESQPILERREARAER